MKAFFITSVLVASATALITPPPLPIGSVTVVTVPAATVTVVAEKPSDHAANVALVGAAAAYSCPSGQYLTYAIGSKPLPGLSLKVAQAYFTKWTNDAPGTHVKSSGNNGVGSTRSWIYTQSSLQTNTAVNDTLTQIITPTSGNSNLEQRWSILSTESYYSGTLLLYQAYKDLTIGENSAGNVMLQYFMNVCANNQNLANNALPTIIGDSLAYWVANAK